MFLYSYFTIKGTYQFFTIKLQNGVSCPSPPKGTLRISSIKRNASKSVYSTGFKDILVILFVKIDTVKLRFPH